MADVLSTAVTQIAAWSEADVTGKRWTCKHIHIVLSTNGAGTTGTKIPASALGYKFLSQVSNLVKSDSLVVIPASPNYDGSEIVLGGGTSSATASYSGTFSCVVKGLTLPFNG